MNKYNIGQVLYYLEEGQIQEFIVEVIEFYVDDGVILYSAHFNEEWHKEHDCCLSKEILIRKQIAYLHEELSKLQDK